MNGLQFHKKWYLLHTKYNAFPHDPPLPLPHKPAHHSSDNYF